MPFSSRVALLIGKESMQDTASVMENKTYKSKKPAEEQIVFNLRRLS